MCMCSILILFAGINRNLTYFDIFGTCCILYTAQSMEEKIAWTSPDVAPTHIRTLPSTAKPQKGHAGISSIQIKYELLQTVYVYESVT